MMNQEENQVKYFEGWIKEKCKKCNSKIKISYHETPFTRFINNHLKILGEPSKYDGIFKVHGHIKKEKHKKKYYVLCEGCKNEKIN